MICHNNKTNKLQNLCLGQYSISLDFYLISMPNSNITEILLAQNHRIHIS